MPGRTLLAPLLLSLAGCTAAGDRTGPPPGAAAADAAGSSPPATAAADSAIAAHFAAFAAAGAFVLYEDHTGRMHVYNPERAAQRFLPASTFKILNSLIALELGLVADQHEVIAWDGVDRGDIMYMDDIAGRRLSGKTGWARQGGVNYGWLVGWVDHGDRTWFFATQIESSDPEFPMRRAQQEITRGALRALDVLP
jgi:beta-lactamase class D